MFICRNRVIIWWGPVTFHLPQAFFRSGSVLLQDYTKLRIIPLTRYQVTNTAATINNETPHHCQVQTIRLKIPVYYYHYLCIGRGKSKDNCCGGQKCNFKICFKNVVTWLDVRFADYQTICLAIKHSHSIISKGQHSNFNVHQTRLMIPSMDPHTHNTVLIPKFWSKHPKHNS